MIHVGRTTHGPCRRCCRVLPIEKLRPGALFYIQFSRLVLSIDRWWSILSHSNRVLSHGIRTHRLLLAVHGECGVPKHVCMGAMGVQVVSEISFSDRLQNRNASRRASPYPLSSCSGFPSQGSHSPSSAAFALTFFHLRTTAFVSGTMQQRMKYSKTTRKNPMTRDRPMEQNSSSWNCEIVRKH